MKNIINIQYNGQSFPYMIEYVKGNNVPESKNINWCSDNGIVRILQTNTNYYRYKNEWYNVNKLRNISNQYIPERVDTTNIRLYIPAHSISTYVKGVKYALTLNIWIHGIKIELGSFIFKPNDTVAISTGSIKNGNNEYFECIDFNIVNPFYLMYSDEWIDFRHLICEEPLAINNTGSSLQASLFVVTEFDDYYMIKEDCVGGNTSFCLAEESDFLKLNISTSINPFGIKCDLHHNVVYDWFLNYLAETYDINSSVNNIKYEFVIKNKDSIIAETTDERKYFNFIMNTPYNDGKISQTFLWSEFMQRNHILSQFFNSWETFEEGWNIVASLLVIKDDEEVFTVVSNELPITQKLFSMFTKGGIEKIIDIADMEINTYNVVNKIENKIVQIERPNESKSNIVQPVFFRVKDTETLTLHPAVTENISINLDDYKSKVDRFVLQIDGYRFDQIGANKYGILFKITGNTLPATTVTGTYYILNENLELVTTGKYACIR